MFNSKTTHFQQSDVHPSIKFPVSRCSSAPSTKSSSKKCCERLFDMDQDDIIEVWKCSPNKDTLSYYGVGSNILKPEAVVFNQLVEKCLNKAAQTPRRIKPPKSKPASEKSEDQRSEARGSFVLNRPLLKSKINRMPTVQEALDASKALSWLHCHRSLKVKHAFHRTKSNISLKGALDMERSVPKIKDRAQRKNKFTEFQGLMPDNLNREEHPTPYEVAKQREMEQLEKEFHTEPKGYDQLFPQLVQCFERRSQNDPLTEAYECCQRSSKHNGLDIFHSEINIGDAGGGDGARHVIDYEAIGDGAGTDGNVSYGDFTEGPSDVGVTGGVGGTGGVGETGGVGPTGGVEGTGDVQATGDVGATGGAQATGGATGVTGGAGDPSGYTEPDGAEGGGDAKAGPVKPAQGGLFDATTFTKTRLPGKRGKPVKRFDEKRPRMSLRLPLPLHRVSTKPPRPSFWSDEVSESGLSPTQTLTPPTQSILRHRLTDNLQIVAKVKKEKKSRITSNISVPAKKEPKPTCICTVCKFMKRRENEPESPHIRQMKVDEKQRELLDYYKRMCQSENLESFDLDYSVPQRKCEAIKCDCGYYRKLKFSRNLDRMHALQELQKVLSCKYCHIDFELIYKVKTLTDRLCWRLCGLL